MKLGKAEELLVAMIDQLELKMTDMGKLCKVFSELGIEYRNVRCYWCEEEGRRNSVRTFGKGQAVFQVEVDNDTVMCDAHCLFYFDNKGKYLGRGIYG